jgi:Protein of unknown function (DUF2917)
MLTAGQMFTPRSQDLTVRVSANDDGCRYLLHRYSVLGLQRPRQVRVRADLGTLWVTVDGDPADIQLTAGASRVFDGPATVVVSPLGGEAIASLSALRSLTGPRGCWRGFEACSVRLGRYLMPTKLARWTRSARSPA